jgi:hypothetical protein
MTEKDLADLRQAKALLEHPSLAVRVSNRIGAPIEKGIEHLPEGWAKVVQAATKAALSKALDAAVMTLDENSAKPPATFLHKLSVAASGAVGGAFGLATLPIELTLSTTIMLRSIADIARSHGEDIRQLEVKLACLEVFGLGGFSPSDDSAETGYYAARAALAGAVREAAQYIAQVGLTEGGSPAVLRLITGIAARFGVAVSDKLAAQALPLVGAAGGALINTIFIDHFQDVARGHFTVRRLERTYGTEDVRRQYDRL